MPGDPDYDPGAFQSPIWGAPLPPPPLAPPGTPPLMPIPPDTGFNPNDNVGANQPTSPGDFQMGTGPRPDVSAPIGVGGGQAPFVPMPPVPPYAPPQREFQPPSPPPFSPDFRPHDISSLPNTSTRGQQYGGGFSGRGDFQGQGNFGQRGQMPSFMRDFFPQFPQWARGLQRSPYAQYQMQQQPFAPSFFGRPQQPFYDDEMYEQMPEMAEQMPPWAMMGPR